MMVMVVAGMRGEDSSKRQYNKTRADFRPPLSH
jgi:hypothetical protein